MSSALIIALAAGIVAIGVFNYANRRKIALHLKNREPLDDEAFAALFPSNQEGEVAVSIRTLLKPWVTFDIQLLRPEDQFCGDLLLDAMDGMDPEEFLLSVENRWQVKIHQTEAEGLLSIAQLSAAVSRHVNEKSRQHN